MADVQTPGEVFGLGDGWSLQTDLPNDRGDGVHVVKAPELMQFSSSGFSLQQIDGSSTSQTALCFRTSVGGATTEHSHYPRTELRELPANGGWSITDSIAHDFEALLAVQRLPEGKPAVVVVQIHGEGTCKCEILKLRARRYGSNAPNSFTLEARVKGDAAGGELSEVGLPLGEHTLGTPVRVHARVKGGVLSVRVGQERVTHDYRYGKFLEWDSQGLGNQYYWKLGSYCQCSLDEAATPDEFAEVCFWGWSLAHGEQRQEHYVQEPE